jgi:hypothetical protein
VNDITTEVAHASVPSSDSLASLSGTLMVACRSPSSKPSDDFNEFLPLLETMLELVLLGLVPSTHFGKQLHRA